jgi:hypothetical protein
MSVQNIRIQVRRDTAQAWASNNPLLLAGEQGMELDTGKIKYGDGTLRWNELDYAKSDPIVELTNQYDSSYKAELTKPEDVSHVALLDLDDNLYKDPGISYNAKASRLIVKTLVLPNDPVEYEGGAVREMPFTRNADGELIANASGLGMTSEVITQVEQPEFEYEDTNVDYPEGDEIPVDDDVSKVRTVEYNPESDTRQANTRANIVTSNGTGMVLASDGRQWANTITFQHSNSQIQGMILGYRDRDSLRVVTNWYSRGGRRRAHFDFGSDGFFYVQDGGIRVNRGRSDFTGDFLTNSWWGGTVMVNSVRYAKAWSRGDNRYAPGISFHWPNVRGGKIYMNHDGNFIFTKNNIYSLSLLYVAGVAIGKSFSTSIRQGSGNNIDHYASNKRVFVTNSTGVHVDRIRTLNNQPLRTYGNGALYFNDKIVVGYDNDSDDTDLSRPSVAASSIVFGNNTKTKAGELKKTKIFARKQNATKGEPGAIVVVSNKEQVAEFTGTDSGNTTRINGDLHVSGVITGAAGGAVSSANIHTISGGGDISAKLEAAFKAVRENRNMIGIYIAPGKYRLSRSVASGDHGVGRQTAFFSDAYNTAEIDLNSHTIDFQFPVNVSNIFFNCEDTTVGLRFRRGRSDDREDMDSTIRNCDFNCNEGTKSTNSRAVAVQYWGRNLKMHDNRFKTAKYSKACVQVLYESNMVDGIAHAQGWRRTSFVNNTFHALEGAVGIMIGDRISTPSGHQSGAIMYGLVVNNCTIDHGGTLIDTVNTIEAASITGNTCFFNGAPQIRGTRQYMIFNRANSCVISNNAFNNEFSELQNNGATPTASAIRIVAGKNNNTSGNTANDGFTLLG